LFAAGVYLAALLLLGLAGAAKVRHPGDTAIALRAAGLPARRWSVRLAAGAEVALAVVAAVAPGPVPAVVVVLSYLAFAAFVAAALARRWPLASCGCLGRADTAPTAGHVAVNLGAALSAAVWAVTGDPGPARLLVHHHGLALGVAALALTAVALVLLTNPLAQRASPRPAQLSPAPPSPPRPW
jgi:hypothetical protein